MNGVADIITKLYKRFFLRDLLSYVCPGLFIIASVALSFNAFKCIIDEINQYGFLGSLLIFLFAFVIGIGINGISEYFIQDITYEYPVPSTSRQKFFIRKIEMSYKSHKITMSRGNGGQKLEVTLDFSFIDKQRDRYIILKQMGRNNALTILICAFIVSFSPELRTMGDITSFALTILSIGLFINARKTYNNQTDFEYVIKYKLGAIIENAKRNI